MVWWVRQTVGLAQLISPLGESRMALARARSAATATLVLGSLLAGSLASASAAGAATTAPAKTTWKVTHPQLDWAGSQVAKHEPATGPVILPDATETPGLDVSSYQGNVGWSTVAADGAKFAYVKATEATDYTNPYFAQQYDGSYDAGLIRGAYHFAVPSTSSSGATQADYFIAHGGGWSDDGKTLPGMLDMEWNPYGAACYGLTDAQMVAWVLSFSNEYHAREGVWPVIYTATSWWSECTGNTGGFATTNPLMLANYNGSPGTMPYDWTYQTIWQWADSGTFPGDQDYFNGDESRLQALADG
jgi:GH25 family lysozyme M1 (1,4-beta-N-acetylmuramidase)